MLREENFNFDLVEQKTDAPKSYLLKFDYKISYYFSFPTFYNFCTCGACADGTTGF